MFDVSYLLLAKSGEVVSHYSNLNLVQDDYCRRAFWHIIQPIGLAAFPVTRAQNCGRDDPSLHNLLIVHDDKGAEKFD